MATSSRSLHNSIVRLTATEGATAAEYALLVAFIAVAIVGAVVFFGGAVFSLFDTFPRSLVS